MIIIDWNTLKKCPECGSGALDIESRDAIRINYYIYCLDCRHEGPEAWAENGNIKLQPVADKAIYNWQKS